MFRYAVLVQRAEDGGFGAWCPDLPGCVAAGDSEALAIAEMAKAIEVHLEGMREGGLTIPYPTAVAATIVTDAA
ncbi:MAG: type II toxin-antitoxin system HicB family antitoxin [Actinophytocola sp.]|uniref:type II toxin-antitoxin system HicB family antitoxin n=1 Tax=Actinophytocola sp. TaxID=1872138 RepID=UPI001320FBF5|nr:type II toxin-antitoxin system HicB family antitoxin [Actinophytocola sp.]MPZ85065.1 type II toxin-antitoxin system HicB family antitoxin [Actinophytocola sp.]